MLGTLDQDSSFHLLILWCRASTFPLCLRSSRHNTICFVVSGKITTYSEHKGALHEKAFHGYQGCKTRQLTQQGLRAYYVPGSVVKTRGESQVHKLINKLIISAADTHNTNERPQEGHFKRGDQGRLLWSETYMMRKSIPGRRNSLFQGPEARASLAGMSLKEKSMSLE